MGAASARCCNLEHAQTFESSPIPRVHVENRPDGFDVGEFVAENRGRIDQFYDVHREHSIGEGSFAFVYEARNMATGQKRAVKAINRKNLRSNSKYENEIMMHRMMDYPGVARIVESFEDSKNIFLVLEFCTGGELFDAIIDEGPFSEPLSGTLLRQMLRTAAYLHAAHVAHRDMKAENWLFQLPVKLGNLEEVKLKLVDFGLARELPPGVHARTKAGSPYYVAPEVLQGKYGPKPSS